jgi:hypothetical protein
MKYRWLQINGGWMLNGWWINVYLMVDDKWIDCQSSKDEVWKKC